RSLSPARSTRLRRACSRCNTRSCARKTSRCKGAVAKRIGAEGKPMKKLNVAMIGYQFMGRAHSNAWRQVGRFFDLPYEPVLKVVCGRNQTELAKAAHTLGFEAHSTSWQETIARKD